MWAVPKLVRVAIGIVIENGLCLITRRLADAELPGLWEFPGGKIEPDETPEVAAVRELKEELGITVEAIQTLDPIEHTYPHAWVVLYPILCRHVSGSPAAIECAEFQWIGLKSLAALPMPAGNATLIQTLTASRLQFPDPPANLAGPNAGD